MYSTGKKLVEVCEQEEIDVLFLDIDMPEVDGFKIAESVRKKELNCLIVFCSNYSDFVFKSFRYEPFSFLCKENYQEQLSDVCVVDELPIHIYRLCSVISGIPRQR